MNPKSVTILSDRIDADLLPFVRRPSRYIGGEVNQIEKDLDKCDLTVALCFPDIYEIAASNTGIAIIYDILNRLPYAAAERCFAPWKDAEQIMREKSIPLFTLESKAAVRDFDIVGFSLSTELCFTNMLMMLDLAGIPLRTEDRTDSDPVVIAGGQLSNCAEPIAAFIDVFILGDGEDAVVQLADFIAEMKVYGLNRAELLEDIARKFNFAYVPSLYRFEYKDDKIKSFRPLIAGLPTEFKNAVVDDFELAPVPEAPIVPFIQPVHERISIEIMRGCPGRCRFCQASFCRRPIRFRSVDTIVRIAKQQYKSTGLDTVGLLSLSSGDYPYLEQLITTLRRYFEPRHVGVSMPSLRVRETLALLPAMATSVRKGGLTIAVEAASEKLRRVINKPITDADLLSAVRSAYEEGFKRVKLYFMAGFESETEDDIERIVDLSLRISELKREVDRKAADVNVTVSWLVPKPHTPFGFMGQRPKEYFENACRIILDRKKVLKAKFVNFKFHDIETSILEAVFARGDRRLADVIQTAYDLGARFDLWTEEFDNSIWQKAFAQHDLDADLAAQKSFTTDDTLPWQHLGGPNKKRLIAHYEQALDIAHNQ